MLKKLVICGTALCFSLAALPLSGQDEGQPTQGPPAPPPARKVPGITAEDRYPNGCVDCHVNYVEMKMDTRISTLMGRWSESVEPKLLAKAQAAAPAGLAIKGKHPVVADAGKNVPAKCLACHGANSKTSPPFAALIHNIHLSGGEQSHFMTFFQGECTHCHKIGLESGRWTMPSASEN